MEPRKAHLIRRLGLAQDAVVLGAEHIHRQWEIINELDRQRRSTELAQVLLETYCDTQALHERDLQRLAEELGVPPEARVLD